MSLVPVPGDPGERLPAVVGSAVPDRVRAAAIRRYARPDDWLVNQLPMGMLEDDFFVRFVRIFQAVATTILEDVDNLDNVLDITVAPDAVVRWLGSWIDVDDIDSSLDHELQRRIVHESGRRLAWRGTRLGVQSLVELISGAPAVVEDSGGIFAEGTTDHRTPFVRIDAASTGWLPDDAFVAVLAQELPANVDYAIFVDGRRLWPPPPPEPEPASSRSEAWPAGWPQEWPTDGPVLAPGHFDDDPEAPDA